MKIKDLRLALSATPKKADIRFYLNGILIKQDTIVASDGQRLCYISDCNNEIPDDQIILPVDSIKSLLKKIGAKRENALVDIVLINKQYQLQCIDQIEVFTPIDHVYPDFGKLITKIKEHNINDNIHHQFNWQYVGDAEKDINKYMGSDSFKYFRVLPDAGYFRPEDNIIYIIMPMRS